MPSTGTPPIAAERAYDYTKAQIISGGLAGGQLVSEAVVGAELGISRTPVHEAFLRLGAEQLLDLVSRKGAIVRPLTPTETADVLAMRRGIETSSAEQVFLKGGAGERIAGLLAENLERQHAAVSAGDVDTFVAADDDFHAVMIEAAGNPIAAHFYQQLRDRQQRLRNLLLRIEPSMLSSSYDDHRDLAQRLISGDRDGFLARLNLHLDRYQGAL